ncbi:hypothetical protein RJ641_014194 [Dillenia turbinata]|uniref:Uncharacterized protein n=1 Tax=Dillenia turbinata TaxID=194707 RepID=A0AAN8UZE5_9MAGN
MPTPPSTPGYGYGVWSKATPSYMEATQEELNDEKSASNDNKCLEHNCSLTSAFAISRAFLPAVLFLGILLPFLFLRVAFLVLKSATLCSSSFDCIGWRFFGGSIVTVLGISSSRYISPLASSPLENPGKALLLGNYARFLNQVLGDPERAEEYFERAILENLEDGNRLCVYAYLISRRHKGASRA